ncbi:hypothetical protein [Geoglobus acetivorans]|uniref:Uncharacterized protein n=1 Tax=Geoglobus acetivorans TaxID=565033 RepID=A0ABZ3H5F8_GEOAI|nr:hypothetical protein [Geoglobus acetivorans]
MKIVVSGIIYTFSDSVTLSDIAKFQIALSDCFAGVQQKIGPSCHGVLLKSSAF